MHVASDATTAPSRCMKTEGPKAISFGPVFTEQTQWLFR